MEKKIQSRQEYFITFTDEEADTLGIKQGDKFSFKIQDDGVLLQKYSELELDLSKFPRESLEMLIVGSVEKDITISQYLEEIISKFVEN